MGQEISTFHNERVFILKVINDNLVWSYSKEGEQISPEQPYRLKSENCAQITKDNQGDMSFEPNHISPCVSPEENTKNRPQNGPGQYVMPIVSQKL
ncbi:MAG TPA: hypothetical protein VH500_22790 [Nitrososphaeraceae archaeon]